MNWAAIPFIILIYAAGVCFYLGGYTSIRRSRRSNVVAWDGPVGLAVGFICHLLVVWMVVKAT